MFKFNVIMFLLRKDRRGSNSEKEVKLGQVKRLTFFQEKTDNLVNFRASIDPCTSTCESYST